MRNSAKLFWIVTSAIYSLCSMDRDTKRQAVSPSARTQSVQAYAIPPLKLMCALRCMTHYPTIKKQFGAMYANTLFFDGVTSGTDTSENNIRLVDYYNSFLAKLPFNETNPVCTIQHMQNNMALLTVSTSTESRSCIVDYNKGNSYIPSFVYKIKRCIVSANNKLMVGFIEQALSNRLIFYDVMNNQHVELPITYTQQDASVYLHPKQGIKLLQFISDSNDNEDKEIIYGLGTHDLLLSKLKCHNMPKQCSIKVRVLNNDAASAIHLVTSWHKYKHCLVGLMHKPPSSKKRCQLYTLSNYETIWAQTKSQNLLGTIINIPGSSAFVIKAIQSKDNGIEALLYSKKQQAIRIVHYRPTPEDAPTQIETIYNTKLAATYQSPICTFIPKHPSYIVIANFATDISNNQPGILIDYHKQPTDASAKRELPNLSHITDLFIDNDTDAIIGTKLGGKIAAIYPLEEA